MSGEMAEQDIDDAITYEDEGEYFCNICDDTGIDQEETDSEGRLTGCACSCRFGSVLQELWSEE